MPNELDVIGLAVQSGAVGISGGLIWLLNKIVKGFKETIDNHMHESSMAMKIVAKSNIQVARALQKLNDVADIAVKDSEKRDNAILKKLRNHK